MLKSLRRKIIGDLKANRGQFFAVWLVVTLGTAFYGAMYPAGVNMLNSFYCTYDQLHYMDFQVQFESAEPDHLNAVQNIPGVEFVEGRLVVESGLQLKPDQKYLIHLRLISVPDDRAPTVNLSDLVEGHELQKDNEILLLKSFADHHQIKAGDTLHIWINGEKQEFEVAGLVFNAEYLVAGSGPASPFPTPSSFGVAWLRYSRLAGTTRQQGLINDVVIRLQGKSEEENPGLEKAVRQSLEDIFANQAGTVIASRIQTSSGGVVDANINGNFPIMIFFSGIFLVGSTLITSVLLARLVESERQRIGTLRAMGVTRGELVRHYLSFGLIIGISGGLVGSVLGYLNSFWVMDTYIGYIAGGTLPGFVNRPQILFILLGFAVAVLGSTFAGMYPAWVQSATPPGIALRPAAPKTPNVVSRLQMRFLPSPLRWAIRNLLRVPGRSLSTALGVIAGSMMIFSSLALWDTMLINFDDYFSASAFDLRVDMAAFQSAGALETQVAEIEGVKGVQGALIGPVSVTSTDGRHFDTVAIAMDDNDPFFELRTLEGAEAFSSTDGVWIGHNLQRVSGVEVGDTVTLHALNQEYPVKVLGVVSYTLGSPVFVPRSLMQQWTPGGIFPANTLLVRVDEGRADTVRDALVDLPGMRAVELMPDFESDVDHYLEYFRSGTLIFGTFGYILTLAVLFNTVNGSLRERRDELAVMRALGSTPLEIALTVTLELMLMIVIGMLIGIPIGREVGFWLNRTYETDFFGQVSTIRPVSSLIGAISLIVIVLLAELPGLRSVHKVDLGQVSKSQSF